jgi:hypothetical protein
MAKKRDLPGFAEKRKILFGAKTTPEKLRDTGELFLEAERYDDALEFFQRGHADDLTRAVADRAMEDGNVPLYMRAKRVLGEPVEKEEWNRLAATAEGQGRFSMAYVSFVKAGNETEAQRLRQLLPSQDARADAEAEEADDGPTNSEDGQPPVEGAEGPDAQDE